MWHPPQLPSITSVLIVFCVTWLTSHLTHRKFRSIPSVLIVCQMFDFLKIREDFENIIFPFRTPAKTTNRYVRSVTNICRNIFYEQTFSSPFNRGFAILLRKKTESKVGDFFKGRQSSCGFLETGGGKEREPGWIQTCYWFLLLRQKLCVSRAERNSSFGKF